MSNRPQAEEEGKGYPVGSVEKQREGLTELTNFIDDLEPLDKLNNLPIATKPRIFTIDSALTDTTDHNIESDIEKTTKFLASLEELEKFYSEPNTVGSLFSNTAVLKELDENKLLPISQENKNIILKYGMQSFIEVLKKELTEKEENTTASTTTAIPHIYKEIINSGGLTLLESLKQNLEVFTTGSLGVDGQVLNKPERLPVITQIYEELEETKPDSSDEIKQFLDSHTQVKQNAIPNLEKALSDYKKVQQVAKTRSEERRTQQGKLPEGQVERRRTDIFVRCETFLNKDNPVITQLIESNTILTQGTLGVYDYTAKAIVTSNSAIFFKIKEDVVSNKGENITVIIVYGTNGNKYALLPEQLKRTEKKTYSIPGETFVYANYPEVLYRTIKKEKVNAKPVAMSDYNWNEQNGRTRWLLTVPTTVQKVPSGTEDYSPSLGQNNVWWVKVRIVSKKPVDVPEVVFVENNYLRQQSQLTGSLESNDLVPGSEGNVSRSDDKPSEMTIDQFPGNEEPIQKSKGLTPFKMPGYNDPSIAMSESPNAEYDGKTTEYKNLAKRLEPVNSKIHRYLLTKFSKKL